MLMGLESNISSLDAAYLMLYKMMKMQYEIEREKREKMLKQHPAFRNLFFLKSRILFNVVKVKIKHQTRSEMTQ